MGSSLGSGKRRGLSLSDVEEWEGIAEERRREEAVRRTTVLPPLPPPPDPKSAVKSIPVSSIETLFVQMDELLEQMHLEYPIRSRRMQRDLKWLRLLAHGRGLSWGKKSRFAP